MAGVRYGLKSQRLGDHLIQMRRDLKWTQADVCVRLAGLGLKCQTSRLSKHEAGRVPSAELLWALARVFGVSVDSLVERVAADLGLIATPAVGKRTATLPPSPEDHTPRGDHMFTSLLAHVDPDQMLEFSREFTRLIEKYQRPFRPKRGKVG